MELWLEIASGVEGRGGKGRGPRVLHTRTPGSAEVMLLSGGAPRAGNEAAALLQAERKGSNAVTKECFSFFFSKFNNREDVLESILPVVAVLVVVVVSRWWQSRLDQMIYRDLGSFVFDDDLCCSLSEFHRTATTTTTTHHHHHASFHLRRIPRPFSPSPPPAGQQQLLTPVSPGFFSSYEIIFE
ncbi:hypothetical protein BD324DRAFT_634415 [Kockovaella imperatae]|uniref:Uncharacterized protein n=1 Tax=Kockovaella imperatae TaxID=4999 RepID=A0A1Y1UC59_9TREE|nr:hypothetical protein BD324DRAFT_634415 [Kockovaella imperatae]ORX34665.1 hypothetical protein BD324DRAFT_634415 [Kockovaella imperatae]